MTPDWIFDAGLGVIILAVVLGTIHWIKQGAAAISKLIPPPPTKAKEVGVLEIHISRGKVVLWFEDAQPAGTGAAIVEKFGGPEACSVVSGIKQPDGIIILKKDRQ